MTPNLDRTAERIGSSATRPKVVIALLLIALASGAAFAAVTLNTQNTDPLSANEATLNDSQYISVDDINVTYTGFTADSVDVIVNNTDASAHTVDISVEVLNGGSQVTSSTASSVEISADSTHTETVTINAEIFDFDIINVLVRQLS